MKANLKLCGWALYDFANTIFSAVVLTFYFPLYLTGLAGKNLQLGFATTAAMMLAGLVVPWLGALSDRTGKTKAYLIRTTLLSVLFTGLLSLFTTVPLLVGGFLAACFFFHASLVFYYALLPVVETPERQGFASGLGTALGYLGVLFAIPLAHWVDSYFGRRFVFLAAGGLFFLFSLPLFFWVPEREVFFPSPASLKLFGTESAKVFRTVKSFLKDRKLLFFFLGNFFVMEAMNTVIFWLVIYMARVFHPPQTHLIIVFLGLNLGAFLFGFVAGFFTDRMGAHKTLLAAAGALFGTILALGLTQNFWVFVALAVTGGAFGLAGVWTAARKRVVELAPAEAVGEYFGLYNLTTKISVAGSLIFAILADRFSLQTALLSLSIPSGLGMLLLFLSRRSATPYSSS